MLLLRFWRYAKAKPRPLERARERAARELKESERAREGAERERERAVLQREKERGRERGRENLPIIRSSRGLLDVAN